jgi:predicted alpha/beta hydrolase
MVNRECEIVSITARDGTRLSGRYYHISDTAPLQIQAHGYRGHPLRDFAGGARMCLDAGHNLLLIDQRAQGDSGGKTISFGINLKLNLLKTVMIFILI